MRRLPALRRFLAAITAATLAETEEEPLLFFFRSFLFFFRIKASSPFAIAATNSEWKRKEAVYGAATYIYAFSMGGAVIYMLLLFTAFAFCTQQKCCCTQQIMWSGKNVLHINFKNPSFSFSFFLVLFVQFVSLSPSFTSHSIAIVVVFSFCGVSSSSSLSLFVCCHCHCWVWLGICINHTDWQPIWLIRIGNLFNFN